MMKNLENLLVKNSGLKVVCNGGESDNNLIQLVNELVENNGFKVKKAKIDDKFIDNFWEDNAKKLISAIALGLIYNATWNKRLGKYYKEEILLSDILSNLGGKKKYLYLAGLSKKNNTKMYNPLDCLEQKGFFKHFGSKMSFKNEEQDEELRKKLKKIYQEQEKIEYIENGIHPYVAETFKKILEEKEEVLLALEQYVRAIIKSYMIKFSVI
jgi:hypothetical protein